MNKQELDKIYETLAEEILAEKFGLRKLDERFVQSDLSFVPKLKKAEGQMKFFSMYNRADTMRLSEEDRELLASWTEKEDPPGPVIDMIARTWQIVLAGEYDEGEITYMLRFIPEAAHLPANALIFMFMDTFPEGRASEIDWEEEEKKEAVFYSVKKQYEDLIKSKGDIPVYLIKG